MKLRGFGGEPLVPLCFTVYSPQGCHPCCAKSLNAEEELRAIQVRVTTAINLSRFRRWCKFLRSRFQEFNRFQVIFRSFFQIEKII